MSQKLGIVEWYNSDGYGVMLADNEQVFIHKSNFLKIESILKGDYLLASEIRFNSKKNRKEARGIKTISFSDLLKFENENYGFKLMSCLYDKVMPSETIDFVKRQFRALNYLGNHKDYVLLNSFIVYLENKSTQQANELLDEIKKYYYLNSSQYYKNILWLRCFFVVNDFTENIIKCINIAKHRLTPKRLTDWDENLTFDINLISNCLRELDKKQLNYLYNDLPVELQIELNDRFILKFFSDAKLDLLSEEFNFILKNLDVNRRDRLIEEVIINWHKVSGGETVEYLIEVINKFSDIDVLVDYIYLKTDLKDEIFRVYKTKKIKVVSNKFIEQKFYELKTHKVIELDNPITEFIYSYKEIVRRNSEENYSKKYWQNVINDNCKIHIEFREFLKNNWNKVINNSSNEILEIALNNFNFEESFLEIIIGKSDNIEELYNKLFSGLLIRFPKNLLLSKLVSDHSFRIKLLECNFNNYNLKHIIHPVIEIYLNKIKKTNDNYKVALDIFKIKEKICIQENRESYSYKQKYIDFLSQVAEFIGFSNIEFRNFILSFFPMNNLNYFSANNWTDEFILKCENDRFIRIRELLYTCFDVSLKLKEIIRKNCFSATDLANYTYCPASYVIPRKFDIAKVENEKILIGEEFHKKNHLLEYLTNFTTSHYSSINVQSKLDSSNEFLRIKQSVLEFNGHNDDKTIFYSKEKKISGIPDYIFFHKNSGRFAVEEKFTFKTNEQITREYPNHRIQALTYLYGLSSLQLTNVYLIYWFLDKDDSYLGYKVRDIVLFNITKSESGKIEIIKTFNDLEKIENNQKINLPVSFPNYNKCAICDYFAYCSYKTGKENFIQLS